MSTSVGPTKPAFSYAQAAKGLAPSRSVSQPQTDSSAAASENGSKEHELSNDLSKSDIISAPLNGKTEERHEIKFAGKENAPPTVPGETSLEGRLPAASTPLSASITGEFASASSKDGESPFQNEASDLWDKQSQVSTFIEKTNQPNEKTKPKDTEDDWEKVSVPSNPTEKELKAAPIPPVNIWQQRKEAQDAKLREIVTRRPSANPTPTVKSKSHTATPTAELKGKPNEKGTAPSEKEAVNPKKKSESPKVNDEGRKQQSQYQQNRTVSQENKGSTPAVPPPVGDAQSWPTPETSLADERRKSISQDKVEKADSKTGITKSHGKQWLPVAYVPSAKFNTPLPPAASKRGGRFSTRGREATGRGGHLAQGSVGGDKNDQMSSMGPPPLPKQSQDQERGRGPESQRSGRASSVPTQSRRSNSAGAAQQEMRKIPGNVTKPRVGPDSAKVGLVDASKPTVTNEDISSRPSKDSRSSSRPTNTTPASFLSNDSDVKNAQATAEDTHAHPKLDSNTRRSVPANWYNEASGTGSRAPGDGGKDRDFAKTREFSGRPEQVREKVNSWKDREEGDLSGRREARPERGRGSYRGRIQTSFAHQTNAHPYTAPLPQQPFSQYKSNSFQENRQRQASQPYAQMQPLQPTRSNPRSQSISTASMYPTYSNNMPGLQGPLSPIHTEIPMYGYPAPIHQNIMSAMPYNAALDSYALLSMVSQQLEYYFSIDNLCKDMFLRTHMDSQGYVLLSVIADFKRIRALTEDMDMLRHVCQQAKSIEFRPGEDGVDRLRRREGWDQWVRPMEERVPSAQNEGPPILPRQSRKANHAGASAFPKFHDPSFAMNQMRASSWANHGVEDPLSPNSPPAPYPPGMSTLDNRITEPAIGTTDLTMPAAEFTPINDFEGIPKLDGVMSPLLPTVSHLSLGGQTNGITPSKEGADPENAFPDEKIAELTVVSRTDESATPLSALPFVSMSSRTFSNGSIDSHPNLAASSHQTTKINGTSGLRGGAGSPEIHDQSNVQAEDHGVSLTNGFPNEQMPVFWVKDEVGSVDLHHDGLAHEPYLTLRARALAQRTQGNSNEAMDVLYEFWSHFLIRNFNNGMYREFFAFAQQDLQNGLDGGNKRLIRYYEALLSGKKLLADQVAIDLIKVAENETGENRPVFQKLRSAFRNGAFDFANRIKLSKIASAELKLQLDK